MATLTVSDDSLRLSLSRLEKLAGLHRDIDVPLSAVRGAGVEPDPLTAVHGLRSPGLGIARVTKIGTWRRDGRKTFVAARAGVPAVRVTLSGADLDELLVSTPEAGRIAAELAARRPRP